MSVQEYSSDALAPQYDSTGILVNRLSTWKYAVEYLLNYLQGYLALQKQTTSGFEKLRKGLAEPPQFLVSPETSANKQGKKEQPTATSLAVSAGPNTLVAAFGTLERKTEYLGSQSESAANSIKNNLIPHLQSALKDIEQQYKTLKSSNSKLSKAIEKSRSETEKLVEKLGKYAAHHGQMEPVDDPYVLKRRVAASIAEQVQLENETAEQGLSLQNNFLAFEEHLVNIIQQTFNNLQHVIETFGTAHITSFTEISASFATIDKSKEWSDFLEHNKGRLVPQSGYQRTVENVSFHNDDDPSTKPLIAGHLTRTTTVLKKLQTSFYAVTPSGYLQEFKSESPSVDPTPTLSLYLPHSVLGSLPPPNSADLTFKINAKNSNKKFGRGHSYQFRASSYDELSEWYYAIARKCVSETPNSGAALSPEGTEEAYGREGTPTATAMSSEPESVPASPSAANNNPFAAIPPKTQAAAVHEPAHVPAHVSTQSHGQVPASPAVGGHHAVGEPDVHLPSEPVVASVATDTIHPVNFNK